MDALAKAIPGVGDVEYTMASSREDVERAAALVYQEYLRHGYILPQYYRSGLRLTLHNALPGTTTFVARHQHAIVASVTLIPDSPLGLPMDTAYQADVDRLRQAGRRICEIGQLAVNAELFGSKLFSLYNFRKLDFLFTLFKFAFQYALFIGRFDDMCIVTDPRAIVFKFLPFEPIGEVKYYGFDRVAIKRKAAIPKRIDLTTIQARAKKRPGLWKMYLGDRLPAELFNHTAPLSREDLRYFFVEKTDLFQKAKKDQLAYIASCYQLDAAELIPS